MVVCIIIEGVGSVSSFLCKAHERLDRRFFLCSIHRAPNDVTTSPPYPHVLPPGPGRASFPSSPAPNLFVRLLCLPMFGWFLHCLVKWRPRPRSRSRHHPYLYFLMHLVLCFMAPKTRGTSNGANEPDNHRLAWWDHSKRPWHHILGWGRY
jgi:hypothetical protein